MAFQLKTTLAAAGVLAAVSVASAGNEPGKYFQVPLGYGHLVVVTCATNDMAAVNVLVAEALAIKGSDAKPSVELAHSFCARFNTMFPLTIALVADVRAKMQAEGYVRPVPKMGIYQGGPALTVSDDKLGNFEIQD